MSEGSRSTISVTGSILEQRLLELARRDRDALAADLPRRRLGLGGEVVPDEDQLRAGVAQVVLDLAALVEHVQRHRDRAGPQDPVVHDHEVRHVREHQRDAIARGDATLAQHPRDAHRGLLEQSVAQLEVVELDGDLLGVPFRGLGQDLGKVHCSTSLSVAGELRGSLLQERLHALQEIGRLGALLLQRRLELEDLRQPWVRRCVERALDRRVRAGSPAASRAAIPAAVAWSSPSRRPG